MGRIGGNLAERSQIKQLKPHHRSIARAVVGGGLRNCEIAKLYGLSEAQISIIQNSPLFQAELARLEEDADEVATDLSGEIKMMSARALNIIQQRLLEEPSNPMEKRDQTRTAFDLLDRAGYGKRDNLGSRISAQNVQVNIDARKMSDDELRDNVLGDLLEDE